MSWAVIEADGNGVRETRSGGTLTGEPEKEPEQQKPRMVTWRLCVRLDPGEICDKVFFVEWHPSGHIPPDWYPIESYTQPIETVKQLPEGEEP